MRGRKPLPSAIKILRGNPGHGPINQSEPKPKVAIPSCPKHLPKEAKAEWRRITKELMAVGCLTQLDRAELAAYCMEWARWVEAEVKIQKEGTVLVGPMGGSYQNPQLAVANRALEFIVKFGADFGFNPSSRSRIHVPGPANLQGVSAFARKRGSA